MVRHRASRKVEGARGWTPAPARKNTFARCSKPTATTPGTTGTVRRPDRTIAAQLYQRGVAVKVVENALVLAASRRLIRPPGALPLGTIRSLRLFLPVIEELLELRVSLDYFL